MLKIGDFSRICQVSVKALRHWDGVGLLKPALTDVQTGYRYYTVEQIAEVNRILAFRVMGLSLEQIAKLLHDNLTAADIRAMLRLKQAELEQQIEHAAATLTMVEARLRQIDHQGELPGYEVALKSADALHVLAMRERLNDNQILVDLLRETYPYARGKENTHLMAVFHNEGYADDGVDVEIAFPVGDGSDKPIPLKNDRQMTASTLPVVPLMACTIHSGTWLTLAEGYMHLGRWIEMNGYQMAGAGREIFHQIDWDNQQTATVTEIQFPVVKR